jgi:hypothetical protein
MQRYDLFYDRMWVVLALMFLAQWTKWVVEDDYPAVRAFPWRPWWDTTSVLIGLAGGWYLTIGRF